MKTYLIFCFIKSILSSECNAEWYFDGTGCSRCNNSCLTCSNSTQCTSCTDYMYLNSTSGLCQFCSNGEYYDYTFEVCRSCAGKCTGICQYQQQCFQCTAGQYYDPELLTCTSTCSSPKVVISSSQYNIASLCRSPSFYIDPLSNQIIELGTLKHPYKYMRSAFSEIVNQFSNSNANVYVYIKAGTDNYIEDSTAFILNITSVTVTTYTDNSTTAVSATVTGTKLIQPHVNAKVQFSILNNTSVDYSQAVSAGTLSAHELNFLEIQVSTFFVARSNFNITNIDGFRYSVDIGQNTFFVFFTSLASQTVSILNSSFSITGDIFMSNDPVSVSFNNIAIDASKNEHGISFEVDCNYPEAVLKTSLNFNNITTYFSAARKSYGWPTIIKYQGPGNFTSDNLDFSNYYSNYGEGKPTVLVSSSSNCQPNDGVLQTVSMNGGVYSLNKYSSYIKLCSTILISLDYNIYRKTIVNITNHNFYDYVQASGPMILASGSNADELYYSNSIHTNFSTVIGLVAFSSFTKVIATNLTYNVGSEIVDHILDVSECEYVLIDIINLSNLNISRSTNVNLVNLNNFQTTYTRINELNATNIYTIYGTILSTTTKLNQIIIENCYFSYIYVDYDASVLFVDNSQSVIMQNLVIDSVLTLNSFDFDSSFMHIMDLDLSGNLNTSIYNVTYSNSQSSFVHILSVQNIPDSDIYINIESIRLINMYYEVSRNIIEINQIIMKINLHIVFQRFSTDNIQFKTYGNLIKFGQHLLIPAVITNSSFSNLHSTSIEIYPESQEDVDIRTMLRIENTVFNNISGNYESLLTIYQGSYLEIDNCTFTNIFTYEDAGVLYADYQNTYIVINNSVFKNNTASKNSLFNLDFNSVLECHNCTITNNFAIIYGFLLATGGSSIQFYSSTIQNNYAVQIPLMFLYEGISTSIVDNCIISNNLAMTQSQVKTEMFNVCNKLCFIPQSYKSYLQANIKLLNVQQQHTIFEIFGSTIYFQNSTKIINQNAILVSFGSNIYFINSVISNLTLYSTGMQLTSSLLVIEGTTMNSVNSSSSINMIQSMIDCSIQVRSSVFASSLVSFLNSISTNVSISNTTFKSITCLNYVIQISQSTSTQLFNNTFKDSINVTSSSLSTINTVINLFSNSGVNITNLNAIGVSNTVLSIQNCNETSLQQISISGSTLAIIVKNSNTTVINNSQFNSNGNTAQRQGGAIRVIDSIISISNTNFINNTAIQGGAISNECLNINDCNLVINSSLFVSNTAFSQGGAIYYNFARPNLNQITYANNTAPYGPNIASYAVKVRFAGQATDQMKVTNMVSGVAYEQSIKLELVDYDDQVLVLNNYNHVDYIPLNSSVKIAGSNSALFKNGVATFNNIIIRAIPGSNNVLFNINTLAIDDAKIQSAYGGLLSDNIVSTDFRYCMPGEIQMADYSCSVCQTGTYSLNWNSTQCTLCPSNSECLGGAQISLNSGYWRISTNETYIIECLYSGACNGGYFPNNEYPVACAAGYTGILCNECQTLENTKYQKVSNYQCQECPNPVYNALKITIITVLVFIFLMIIIIINIK